MSENIIVTISRQMGSGGSYVGKMVADRLGIRYIDREILRRLSAYLREDEKILAEREERICGFWERILHGFSYGVPEMGYVPPPLRIIPDEDFFAAEAKIIKELAENGSAVIVGRAGFHILKGKPNLIKVLLHAPREFRMERVMKIYGIAEYSSADELVFESDRQRSRFVKTFTDHDWMDASCYHLCIDTEAVGFPRTVEMIVSLAEKARGASSVKNRRAER
jgi:cytidylate kinase